MKVLLSQNEIDVLYMISHYIGGNPTTTKRGIFTNIHDKFKKYMINPEILDYNNRSKIFGKSSLYFLDLYK